MCSRFMPNVPKIYRQCAGRSTAIDSGSTRHTQVQNARPIRPVPSQVQNVPPVPPTPLPLGGASHTQLDSVIAALQQQTATLQRSQELQATATLRSWTPLIKFHAKKGDSRLERAYGRFSKVLDCIVLRVRYTQVLWTALHYVQFLCSCLI